MADRPFNPDDLGFLLSQELDGEMSAAEQRRLDDARSASADLGRETQEFAAVDALVRRWASKGVELDWTAQAGLIDAEVRGEDAGLEQVDDLLHRWGRTENELDAEDFSSAVVKQIRSLDRGVRSRNLVFRLRAPLAMAAAVVLVVFGTTWFQPQPVTVVSIRSTFVESASVKEEPRTIVSFGRPNVDAVARDTTPPSIGFITLGAGPVGNGSEVAPL